MKLSKILMVGVVMSILSAPAAMAAPRFSLVGVGGMQLADAITTSVAGVSVTAEPALGFGGGALVEFAMGSKFGFELGVLYRQHAVAVTAAGVTETGTAAGLGIPGTLRLWLGRIFSLGLGGYYELSLEDGGAADYGAAGSVRFNIPFGKSVAMLIDGRYHLGFADHSGETYNEVLGLVGLSFGGSGK